MTNTKTNWEQLKTNGGTVTELLAVLSVTEREGVKGPYISAQYSDGETSFSANMFDTTVSDFKKLGIEAGTTVLATVTSSGNNFLNIKSIEPKSSPELSEALAKKAPVDAERAFDEICDIIKRNDCICGMTEIALGLLEENKADFIRSSAACDYHHNELHGLIYHTLRMVQSAEIITEVYPDLCKELLVCGAALHDIGKIKSLKTNDLGGAEMTPDGILREHSLIGILMIHDFVRTNDSIVVTDDALMALEHLIASHHGTHEFGAIQIPALREAMMLHCLDLMDSRIEMFETSLKGMETGQLSSYNKGLGTKVYRPHISPYEY